MKRARYPIVFALLGFAAIVGQIVLQRRFMVVFGGNELTIGAVFAGWMLWAGLGNFVAGKFADRIENVPRALTLVFLAIAVILPLTVIASSLTKAALGIPPSQMMGPPMILLSTFLLLLPLCFAIGAALVIAAKIPATGTSYDIGIVYIFDSIGSAAGGLLFSWFAICYLTPLQGSFFISALLLAGAGLLLFKEAPAKLFAMFVVVIFTILFFTSARIDSKVSEVQWRGFNPIANFDSRFGNITVTENRGEKTLFFDGEPQFTTPLSDTYETAALLPLLMTKNPRRVLLIGGGLSGMINQWRDVPLDSITYVQIDPDVTAAEKTIMVPKGMAEDPRLDIQFVDGRNFLRTAAGKYDIIILQSGDPATAATNRYYTREFFEDAKSALAPGGVIFFGIFEPTNYISGEAQDLLSSVYATLKGVFDHIVVLPLDEYYFAASEEKGALTGDVEELGSRLKASGMRAPTLLSQVLYGIFPERVSQTRKLIEESAARASINTDRRPIAYYAGLVLWASKAGENAAKFLESLQKIRIWHIVAILIAAGIATLLFSKGRKVELVSAWTLAAVGFSSIVYEVVLLIWYQVKVGLLFYRLGIIITAFMVGLGLGAYAAIGILKRFEPRPFVIFLMLVAFAVYMPLLFFVCRAGFPLANFICGAFAGLIYQMAADRLVKEKKLIGKSAGLINFADYLGAAIGSILAAIIMIPIFGLMSTLLVAAAVLIIAALINAILYTYCHRF